MLHCSADSNGGSHKDLIAKYNSGFVRRTSLVRKKYTLLKSQELDAKVRKSLPAPILDLFVKLKVCASAFSLCASPAVSQHVVLPGREFGGQRLKRRKTKKGEQGDSQTERILKWVPFLRW
jgi:hypothetical protein